MNITIYITGDIHGNPFRFSSKKFPEGKQLTKDDFIIVAGDFGLLWENELNRQELHNLKWLMERPWTTLFIDGNHENFQRLNFLPIEEKFGGKVGVVCSNVYHLRRGEIYQIGGKSIFCFGGAYSWDRQLRTLGLSYWEEEVPNYAEMDYGLSQLESVQYNVDYIITHTLPRFLIPILGFSKQPEGKEDPTCKYFDHIANCVTFKKWYFGHMHVNVDLGKFKCLFNDIDKIT
jgi:predicted phosphohydrolase